MNETRNQSDEANCEELEESFLFLATEIATVSRSNVEMDAIFTELLQNIAGKGARDER